MVGPGEATPCSASVLFFSFVAMKCQNSPRHATYRTVLAKQSFSPAISPALAQQTQIGTQQTKHTKHAFHTSRAPSRIVIIVQLHSARPGLLSTYYTQLTPREPELSVCVEPGPCPCIHSGPHWQDPGARHTRLERERERERTHRILRRCHRSADGAPVASAAPMLEGRTFSKVCHGMSDHPPPGPRR
jgi:hypothetical protein